MIKFKIFNQIDNDFIILYSTIKRSKKTLFTDLSWIRANIKHYLNKKDKICFIFFFINDKPFLFLPLIIKQYLFLKVLTLLNSPANDYCEPVYSEWKNEYDDLLKVEWNKIKIQFNFDILFFEKVRDDDVNILKFLYKKKPTFYQSTFFLNLFNLDLNSFYISKNNKKTIETDKRKEKKINKLNCKIFQIDNPMNYLYNHIYLKSEYYKKKKIKTFTAKKLFDFYKEVELLDKEKKIKFKYFILKNNITELSSLFAIFYENIFYYLLPLIYENQFTNLSPGNFLIKKVFEKIGFKENITIDFGPGDEKYKTKWDNHRFKIYYVLNLNNYKGIPYYIFKKLYFNFKKNKILKYIYYKLRFI